MPARGPTHPMRLLPAQVGRVDYRENLFTPKQTSKMVKIMRRAPEIQDETGILFGKPWVKKNRRTAFFTRRNKDGYFYAGKKRIGEDFLDSASPLARVVRECVAVAEKEFGLVADTAIVTHYLGKTEEDKAGELGYHADSEVDINQDMPIVGFSFGATREFRVRQMNWKAGDATYVLTPESGSGYAMLPGMQKTSKHAVATGTGERFSVTLRANK